jgi:hypothetical protein
MHMNYEHCTRGVQTISFITYLAILLASIPKRIFKVAFYTLIKIILLAILGSTQVSTSFASIGNNPKLVLV